MFKHSLFTTTPLAVFCLTLIISLLSFTARWSVDYMLDSRMWGSQIEYVLSNDNRQYDFLQAYGHPGGPIILVGALIHKILPITYEEAVVVTVILISAIATAGCCVLAFLLKRESLWWVALLPVLSLNFQYQYATPTTAVASIALAFLTLLSLYLYKSKHPIKNIWLVLWGFVAGFAVATRVDVGALFFIAMSAILLHKIGWRRLIIPVIVAGVVFILLDPYMWYMPVQHIQDLLFKITYHYSEFTYSPISFLSLASICTLTFVSALLSLALLVPKVRVLGVVPPYFLCSLLVMSGVLYTILLTSQIQAERYFLPLTLVWEALLPLTVFTLIEGIDFTFARNSNQATFRKSTAAVIIIMLYSYQLALLLQYLHGEEILTYIY